ncbi:VOC family protein [Pseudonocardia eucalypti]|uniref:VOC family protein n=1 Tax=Pseudonocardia eucalypti TaxID=648755 RepID=A0ABP9R7T5_9PSEU
MSLNIAMATLDCADPQKLSAFWAEALRTTVAGDYGEFVMLAPPPGGQVALGFQKVAAPKAGKNRMHLDLHGGAGRVAEVERLVGLGATVLWDQVGAVPGIDWTTMADPEGNEFCVGEES